MRARGVLIVAVLAALAAAPAQAAYRLKPAERRAIDVTIDRFVRDAVQRHDLGASYDFVTPAMRTGISRRAWGHGTTNVMAFPARGTRFHGWTLDLARRGYVMVDLLLQPRRHAHTGAMIFTLELRRVHGRWLVASFVPSASFAGAERTGSMKAFGDYGPLASTNAKPRHVNRLFLIGPALVVLLIVAVPAAIVLRGWRRNRRAERAYGDPLRRELPPLPPRP
jgi:hypothetical protein